MCNRWWPLLTLAAGLTAAGWAAGCSDDGAGEGGGAADAASGADSQADGSEPDSASDAHSSDDGASDTSSPDSGGEDAGQGDSVEPDSVEPDAGPTPTFAGACALEDRVGGFELKHLQTAPGSTVWYTALSGEVKNGVIPNTVLELVDSQGDCQFLRRLNPFCTPTCAPGETCDLDGTCIPYPLNQSVGSVTVSGMAQSSTMRPTGASSYFDSKLPHPAFQAADVIELRAAGAEGVAPFVMHGHGVDDLVFDTIEWVMSPDTSLELHWTPSTGPGSLWFSFNVDQHGLSPVSLVCEVADEGSLVVHGSLVTQLLEYGVSGFATGIASRRTADHVDIEWGCVEFLVGQDVQGLLSVDGHEPCFSDLECSEGFVCNVAINTCVEL